MGVILSLLTYGMRFVLPNPLVVFTSVPFRLGFWDHLMYCPYHWPVYGFFGLFWRFSPGMVTGVLADRQEDGVYLPEV